MNFRIIWKRPGATHITERVPAPNSRRIINDNGTFRPETDGEVQARLIEEITAIGGTMFGVFDKSALPDRFYRGAWEWTGAAVAVNENGARAIETRRLKALRTLAIRDINERIQEAEDLNQQTTVNRLTNKRAQLRQLDLDSELTGKTVEEMKTYRPALFADADVDASRFEGHVRGHVPE